MRNDEIGGYIVRYDGEAYRIYDGYAEALSFAEAYREQHGTRVDIVWMLATITDEEDVESFPGNEETESC